MKADFFSGTPSNFGVARHYPEEKVHIDMNESPSSSTATLACPSRWRWLGRVSLLALVAACSGCALLPPEGSLLGYPTSGLWEVAKRKRLEDCSRDPNIETREQALHCLGRFRKHRDTNTCTDSSAWVSRVAAGIEEP